MKHRPPRLVSLSIIALLGLLSPLVPVNSVVCAQSGRQLPVRLHADDTPADITLTRLFGRSGSEELGLVAGVGDFNGDHITDFLVSYSKFISGIPGAAFVKYGIYLGKPDQREPVSLNIDKREPDVTLDYDFEVIQFINALGDVNGDQIDDLLVIERDDSLRKGNLRILFGSPRLQSGHLNITEQKPDLLIIREMPAVFADITGIADLNGDGVNDLIMVENNHLQATRVYGLLGPFDSGKTIDLRSQKAALIIRVDSRTSANVLAPADVNGDGRADILVKRFIQGEDVRTSPFLLDMVFGTADLAAGRDISLSEGQANATFDTSFIYGSIATGDINGDGSDDLLVGRTLRYDGGPPLETGWIDVVFGSPALQGRIDHVDAKIDGLPPGITDNVVSLADLMSHFSDSLITRDINSDGFADILVGTRGVIDNPRDESLSPGRAHVIFGAADFAGVSLEKEQQDLSIIFGPNQRSSGSPVATGDFNGDGLADIVVGGLVVYVYFGAPLRPPQISQAKYRSGAEELTVSGTDFTGMARIEINGVAVDREITFQAEPNRLVIHGSKAQLNIHDGKNQIAVTRKGTRSNTVKIKLR